MKKGKNYLKAKEAFEDKRYGIKEALDILEKFPKAKFDESVEIHVKLKVDTSKSDQQIRTTVALPFGTGKSKKVAAITSNQADEAKKAGADLVGGEELIEKIKNGKASFDVLVATPEMMPKLAKVAKILGPKGLMPNPKTETVGPKIAVLVESIKKGKATFKSDKGGNVHLVIGKRSFGSQKLLENYETFLKVLEESKPKTVKGKLIQAISISATMSPGIKINNQQ